MQSSSSTSSSEDNNGGMMMEVGLDPTKVHQMLDACSAGHVYTVHALLDEDAMYARQQDLETGRSPLMAAAAVGNVALCRLLLERGGAPWNAVDRRGRCAGNYAHDAEHWSVVNLLVEWGTRSELLLGMMERSNRQKQQQRRRRRRVVSPRSSPRSSPGSSPGSSPRNSPPSSPRSSSPPAGIPVEHEPSTKPDYLRQRVQYTADGKALLDADADAVMMEWERPIMQAHAQVLLQQREHYDPDAEKLTVLNVGFGMGIFDTAVQELGAGRLGQHIIIEAHPDVYRRMLDEKWHEKPGVRICFGTWQDVGPQLIREGVVCDAIFYDTYGEHYTDMQDFHEQIVPGLLRKETGLYSFFNGLAPDNLFFHGVACQCVKLQLAHVGLESEFLTCQMTGGPTNSDTWEGIRRAYWHGRDTYYLPVCKWSEHGPQRREDFLMVPELVRKQQEMSSSPSSCAPQADHHHDAAATADAEHTTAACSMDVEMGGDCKRQRMA